MTPSTERLQRVGNHEGMNGIINNRDCLWQTYFFPIRRMKYLWWQVQIRGKRQIP